MEPAEVVIRSARLDDAAAIARIYGHYVETMPTSFEEVAPDVKEIEDRFLEGSAQYPWLVAERGAAVIGFAYGSAHRARASYRWAVDTTVYLSQGARGQGVGKRLYEELLPILKQQGFFSAFAGIALPNPASIGLHRSFGFEELVVYKEVGFKFGKWHDVCWMELRLRERSEPVHEPVPFAEF